MGRVSIVYLTKYGNNRMCMEYLGERLQGLGHEVIIHSIDETKPDNVPRADLYVFSTPVRMGKLPGKMKRFAKRFSSRGGRYALVVTHASDENAGKWNPDRTVAAMSELLREGGMGPTMDELRVRMKDMKGPPEDNYRGKLDSLAERISNLLS